MTKRIRLATIIVAATSISAVLTGCAASSGPSSDKNSISVVGFSVLKTANEPVISAFQKTDAGKDVKFKRRRTAPPATRHAPSSAACTPTRCTCPSSPT